MSDSDVEVTELRIPKDTDYLKYEKKPKLNRIQRLAQTLREVQSREIKQPDKWDAVVARASGKKVYNDAQVIKHKIKSIIDQRVRRKKKSQKKAEAAAIEPINKRKKGKK
eukprot:Blabericola_migrator_1__2192@NODE_1603_length_4188_cov_396_205775_g1046_i0_p4_GENE_NODE_1603_length_4188_cov_396_205775_g1046_i0NODE_1603_length_4188_cov_396_205775_g1046_i0_p4_ORF_typecomplete_len110_score29_26SURF6/PF04935_12/7e05Myb_DNAbind_4/PF13837_6/0_034Tnp_22_trimer/PF17489_2/1_1Tnp_22_trimer/PF17489_2/2_2e02_NODE_1603_length_4188_cov_396_205775_g1046_i015651894